MRFASLGSGSEGNGLVVEAGGTRVLIDCGFGVRDTATRLARLGLAPRFARRDPRHPRALRSRRRRAGVRGAARHSGLGHVRHADGGLAGASTAWRSVYGFDSHDAFAIDALTIAPFPVPHDAREPVQYRRRRRRAPPRRADRPRRVDRPTSRRASPAATRWCSSATTISTCWHERRLSVSAEAADRRAASATCTTRRRREILARIDTSQLQHVVAAHLSQQNNTPALARARRWPRHSAARRTGSASPTRPTGFDWRGDCV